MNLSGNLAYLNLKFALFDFLIGFINGAELVETRATQVKDVIRTFKVRNHRTFFDGFLVSRFFLCCLGCQLAVNFHLLLSCLKFFFLSDGFCFLPFSLFLLEYSYHTLNAFVHLGLLIAVGDDISFAGKVEVDIEVVSHRVAIVVVVTLNEHIDVMNDCLQFVATLCERTCKQVNVNAVVVTSDGELAHRESRLDMLTDDCCNLLGIVDFVKFKVVRNVLGAGHLPQVVCLFFRLIFETNRRTATRVAIHCRLKHFVYKSHPLVCLLCKPHLLLTAPTETIGLQCFDNFRFRLTIESKFDTVLFFIQSNIYIHHFAFSLAC